MDHSAQPRRILTAEQLRAARALLRLEQRQLADQAGVALPTLKRLEGMTGPLRATYENVARLVAVLEAAGIQFIQENGGGEGVRFVKRSDDRSSQGDKA